MLHFRVLGSGITAPTTSRYPAGYAVETPNGIILLECNGMVMSRLLSYQCDYTRISTVCISHEHNDHSGGLCHLLEAISTMCAIQEKEVTPIMILGPEGTEHNLQRDLTQHWPELDAEQYQSKFYVLEGTKCISTTLSSPDPDKPVITTFGINHVPGMPSVGFRIKHEDKVIVYPGDFGTTQYEELENILRYLEGADLLVLHACAPKPSSSHLTATQAMEIQKLCHAEELLISHVPTHLLEETTRAISVARNANVAYDGMSVKLVI